MANPDPTTPIAAPAAAPAPAPAPAVLPSLPPLKPVKDGLIALLDELSPRRDLVIRDAAGNQYRGRESLPARAQIEMVRCLESLPAAVAEVFVRSDSSPGMAQAILKLVGNEKIIGELARCFALAHDRVVRDARSAGGVIVAAPATADEVLDLFPAEEIILGVLPFFVAPFRRILSPSAEPDGAPAQTGR